MDHWAWEGIDMGCNCTVKMVVIIIIVMGMNWEMGKLRRVILGDWMVSVVWVMVLIQ